MSNIMKSRAVVVGREEQAKPPGMVLPESRVLKRQFLENPPPPLSTDFRTLAPKEAYLEELNRLKAEVEQARTELRRLRSRLSDLPGEPEEDAALEEQEETPPPREEAPPPREALEALEAARQEAGLILEQAEQDARLLREQAQNEGYLEGFDRGYNEAVSEFKRQNEPRAELLAGLVERLGEFEQERLRRSEDELVELVMGIAAKVIGRQLRADPKTVVSMLAETVTRNHSEEYIRITLAEDLLPVDAKTSAEIREMLVQLGANVTVLSDSRAASGTITAETPKGIVDMSVDTQLKNIRSVLGGAGK